MPYYDVTKAVEGENVVLNTMIMNFGRGKPVGGSANSVITETDRASGSVHLADIISLCKIHTRSFPAHGSTHWW
jgi:hypothetical protein